MRSISGFNPKHVLASVYLRDNECIWEIDRRRPIILVVKIPPVTIIFLLSRDLFIFFSADFELVSFVLDFLYNIDR